MFEKNKWFILSQTISLFFISDPRTDTNAPYSILVILSYRIYIIHITNEQFLPSMTKP